MKIKYLFIAFIVLSLVQLVVVGKMVYDRELVFLHGDSFKFVCAPVDPHDALRGKYINLNFAANSVGINTPTDWSTNQPAYLRLGKDEQGYVIILEASPRPFAEDVFQLEVKVTRVDTESYTLYFDYPFNRYYLSEDKAQAAEELYRQSTAKQGTYALVRIPVQGTAVLEAVMINDMPIEEAVGIPPRPQSE